ncbi:hypothetical protein IJJ54_03005 [Candidatus Saccharibacteria bacterium]|nr:hypothetical protein [Candidatus Saccharibacteria bacterium]MBR0483048.1 hypothetical protein [Candidatus Saccharibacteria bacterium]
MAWYPCPVCGKPCVDPREAARHCANAPGHYARIGTRECPDCRGSGKKYSFLGGEVACPRCGGSGVI